VSSLVLLGLLGTVLSTLTLIPHVVQAIRSGRPGGSPSGWMLSFGGSTVWGIYGLVEHDLLVAAPGLVTIPCGLLLSVWSIHHHLRRPVVAPLAPALDQQVTQPVGEFVAAA